MVKVLFVCLGNICRSTMAEGDFIDKVAKKGLEDQIHVESAGTAAYHIGELADKRTRNVLTKRGIDLRSRAQQAKSSHFNDFDLILAMDHNNLVDLQYIEPSNCKADLKLFRDFDPLPGDKIVPDPYYGGENGFEEVYTMVDRTNKELLDFIKTKLLQ